LWLVGRCTARIRDDSGTVYPFQVECAASGDRTVRRAALIANKGKRVLVVEPNNGVDPDSLKTRLGWSGVQSIKVVRHSTMDKRHNAKIDYVALNKIF